MTLLLRRAYLADLIWQALTANAHGVGHRTIADRHQVPASTVRGWLRRISCRLEPVRTWFLGIAVRVGVDPVIPKATGSPLADTLAAVAAATAATTGRFGSEGMLGPLTAAAMATASSAGRLLSPGWPPASVAVGATPVAPAAGALGL
ncbi:MAG: hypothetical protein L0H93_17690 [Nocardioides sp.]|nr:hypothetical protein [Nocardioides sp.]